MQAAPPDEAERLYRRFVGGVSASGLSVAEGIFQADMNVSLVNPWAGDDPARQWQDLLKEGA